MICTVERFQFSNLRGAQQLAEILRSLIENGANPENEKATRVIEAVFMAPFSNPYRYSVSFKTQAFVPFEDISPHLSLWWSNQNENLYYSDRLKKMPYNKDFPSPAEAGAIVNLGASLLNLLKEKKAQPSAFHNLGVKILRKSSTFLKRRI